MLPTGSRENLIALVLGQSKQGLGGTCRARGLLSPCEKLVATKLAQRRLGSDQFGAARAHLVSSPRLARGGRGVARGHGSLTEVVYFGAVRNGLHPTAL